MKPSNDLHEKELSLREDLVNIQDTVLGLNEQEAALRAQRTEVKQMHKQTTVDRHQVIVAIRERQRRLADSFPAGKDDPGGQRLYRQLETLDHARASLKATERQINKQIDDLDRQRRPYIESQQNLLRQVDKTVAAQHDTHFHPTPPRQETRPMNGPEDFRRASAQKQTTPQRANKPIASAQRLDELKQRLHKPKPSPELTPPGMTPSVAKRIKNNKATGDEILRIQKALNAKRGKARDGFKRSAGG